jgi:hypothetical protein
MRRGDWEVVTDDGKRGKKGPGNRGIGVVGKGVGKEVPGRKLRGIGPVS